MTLSRRAPSPSTTTTPLFHPRFVAVVAVVSLSLALVTGLLIWRGDQVGVGVSELLPRPGAADASSMDRLRLTFADPMEPTSLRIQLDPPTLGKLDWLDQRTAVWTPQPALAPDTRYTATILPGLRSAVGHTAREPLVWSFKTRPLRVVYLSDSQDNTPNLWAIAVDTPPGQTASPRRLTSEPSGALEFSVSPNGAEIAYNVYHPDGHADLRVVDVETGVARPLYEDKFARAGLLAWSPAGDVIAWERSALSQSSAQTGLPAVGQPRIWLLTTDGKPVGPAGRQEGVFFRPVWSPAGDRLAFADGVNSAIVVFNFTDSPVSIPADTDGILSWSPDGEHLLIGALSDESPPRQLINRVQLKTLTTQRLTPVDTRLHDSNATYSPDGRLIGFVRSANGFANSQLWLMNADGSEQRPLTEDPKYKDTAVLWSPDSRYILFGRYPATGASSGPELWVVDVLNGRARSLGVTGLLAAWLP